MCVLHPPNVRRENISRRISVTPMKSCTCRYRYRGEDVSLCPRVRWIKRLELRPPRPRPQCSQGHYNIAAAGAVDREFGDILGFFRNCGPEMGSRRAGRGFKRFLEAVGFILAKFEPKRSHGDPIRDQNYGFGTFGMC